MGFVFPIEQLAKHAAHHFQLVFAAEATDLLASLPSVRTGGPLHSKIEGGRRARRCSGMARRCHR